MNRQQFVALTAAASATALSTRPAVAADNVSLAIGQFGAWTSMIAQEGVDAGLFKRANIDVKANYTDGGPDTIAAVTGGGADFGMGIGTTAAIAAFMKGAPIRIVAASFTGSGDIYYFARAESAINSFADLNGKTLGFSRPGSSSFTIAQVLAEQAGVKPTFVASGGMPATLTQVLSGQLDVGWSGVPMSLDLVAQKKIKIVGKGGDAKALQNQTVRVDITSTKFLADHRDLGLRYYRTQAQSVDWMYANLDKAGANIARYNQMAPDLAKQIVPFYPRRSVALAPVAGFDASCKDALDLKFITALPTPEQAKAIFDILPPH
jgi:NitT/TauT family transport system substrate-binding protein